ncbi:ProQ/FINO family protein [Neorhizobium alkalisoli]|uniref:ProQ/FINO family protein n=1 Tax=Neorhizobium alkalisoli TaxID=528178 RepID=UPI000CF86F57|nr:ProQ/FINO family protein [Neorhizobium alkalisoli]
MKPWTASRGPIAATETDVAKASVINTLMTSPAAIFPKKAGDPILPFSIGLFEDLKSRLKPGVGTTALRRAVAVYVHSKRYYFASAQPDAMRHNIDGEVVEPVSAADRILAQERFMTLKRDKEPPSPATVDDNVAAAIPSKNERIRAALLSRKRDPGPASD